MSSNVLKVTKTTMAERVRDLIAGTQKHPPTGPLTIGGQSFTAASLTEVLRSLGDALSAADDAKAAWKDALQKVVTVNATVAPILSDYRSFILATYGNAPATLADFGVTPRKARTPLSTEQTAAAIAKRKATRTARHTMGKKQKESVKGTITTIVSPTPTPSASAPSAPSVPAASAPAPGTSGGTPVSHTG